MSVGRKLLFHRPHVDDFTGTYITDYVLAGLGFLMAATLIYCAWKQKVAERLARRNARNILNPMTSSVTVATYSVIVFSIFYGIMALLGGLTHEFLQTVEPYEDVWDGKAWLITWRVAAGCSMVSVSSILVLTEQLIYQENLFNIPPKVRKAIYVCIVIACISALVFNFIKLFIDPDPYNIGNLFIVYMAFFLLYGAITSILAVRSFVMTCKERHDFYSSSNREDKLYQPTNEEKCRSKPNSSIRWDLLLHAVGPLLIIGGGVFSFVLTPYCSHHDDPHQNYGCPLPNNFNHNSVMHILHALGTVCIGLAEHIALKRRAKLRKVSTSKLFCKTDEDTSAVLIV